MVPFSGAGAKIMRKLDRQQVVDHKIDLRSKVTEVPVVVLMFSDDVVLQIQTEKDVAPPDID